MPHDLLGEERVEREADRRRQRRGVAGSERSAARPGDDEDAEKPQERAGDAGPGQPLAEEERRQHRHPDRIGELQRDELAERDRRHREEPEVLAGKMKEVALQVQVEPGAPDLREAAAAAPDGQDRHHEADRRAVEHQLEGIHVDEDFASRHRHRDEGNHRAHHPGGGQERVERSMPGT